MDWQSCDQQWAELFGWDTGKGLAGWRLSEGCRKMAACGGDVCCYHAGYHPSSKYTHTYSHPSYTCPPSNVKNKNWYIPPHTILHTHLPVLAFFYHTTPHIQTVLLIFPKLLFIFTVLLHLRPGILLIPLSSFLDFFPSSSLCPDHSSWAPLHSSPVLPRHLLILLLFLLISSSFFPSFSWVPPHSSQAPPHSSLVLSELLFFLLKLFFTCREWIQIFCMI